MNLITRHKTHFNPALSQPNIINQTIMLTKPNPRSHENLPNHPILSKLESHSTLTQFNQILTQTITTGLFQNTFAASFLLKSSPNFPLTNTIFSQIKHPDVFCYNLVIRAHSQSANPLTSLSLYHNLLIKGLLPNEYTFCFLLDCCSSGLAVSAGRQVHCHLVKHHLDAAVHSSTSLVHMYGECGAITDALQAFDGMHGRSNASWGAMINAFVNNDHAVDGLRLFRKMKNLSIMPTNATFVSVICACARVGDLVMGRAVHGYIVVNGFVPGVTVGTSLVDMYGKCGAIETAIEVFKVMQERNVASWNCLINGLAMNGCGVHAIELFEEMSVKPNGVTFLGLLQACNHAGLVKDGERYFSEMRLNYGIEPTLKHYGCMVDLYCRAARMEEALEVVKAMPFEPDVVIWVAVLCACRIHGYTELREVITAKVMKMAPSDASGYLLLSDGFAMERRWNDVIGVREMMRMMEIRKVPGCSSICNI